MNPLRLFLLIAFICLLPACKPETAPPTAAPEDLTEATATGTSIQEESALDRFEWPSLQVTTVTGNQYDLTDHREHWVVVNFWATWCAPCRREMPELSELHARRGDIDVIGLAYEEIEAETLRAFLAEFPVSYPIALLDVANPPPDFVTPRGLPTTYLITPDGQVAHQFLGPISAGAIEQMVSDAQDQSNIHQDKEIN